MNTQIQDAILSCDLALVRQVLEIDPLSVHQTNEVGFTALMISCTTGQPEIARVLLEAGAIVSAVSSETGFSALHCAVSHPPIGDGSDIKLIEILLKYGADIDARTFDGETALMFAAWFGNDAAVRLLKKRGANLLFTDRSGRTARDMALAKGNKELAKSLSG